MSKPLNIHIQDKQLPNSIAGRLQMIEELTATEYEDEDGVIHPKQPVISKEEALSLLGIEKPCGD